MNVFYSTMDTRVHHGLYRGVPAAVEGFSTKFWTGPKRVAVVAVPCTHGGGVHAERGHFLIFSALPGRALRGWPGLDRVSASVGWIEFDVEKASQRCPQYL